ncbi:MAG TPA: hypothetical protein VF183_15285, partial [Acidimicrobiales bacterium]
MRATFQRDRTACADVGTVFAAGGEPAPVGPSAGGGRCARDRIERLALADRMRRAPQEGTSVRVSRPCEECLRRAVLHDLPGVHGDDPLAHLCKDAEIVADEHDGHTRRFLELGQ